VEGGIGPFDISVFVSTLRVDDEDVIAVVLVVRLDLDGELRIDGVRRDSRALGSSRDVYRPMEGRCITCQP
jgi:hypothetical protein